MKTKSQIIEMIDKHSDLPGIEGVTDPEETIQSAKELVEEGMRKNNIVLN